MGLILLLALNKPSWIWADFVARSETKLQKEHGIALRRLKEWKRNFVKTLDEAQIQIKEFKTKDRIPEADQYITQLNDLSLTLEQFKQEVPLNIWGRLKTGLHRIIFPVFIELSVDVKIFWLLRLLRNSVTVLNQAFNKKLQIILITSSLLSLSKIKCIIIILIYL